MNLSGIDHRSRLGRLLRAPLALVPKNARVPVLQGPLRGKWWIVGSATHGCWLGSYEWDKQSEFVRLVRPGDVVYDVGANVGFYTLLASVLAGATGRVYAFEPLPQNLHYLRLHLALNSIGNVEVIEAAIADTAGNLRFAEGHDRSEGRLDPAGALVVRSEALDALAAAGRMPPPALIKMDIEGGELAALKGAEALLEASHPTIVLATHGRQVHLECCAFLQRLGYELRGVGGAAADETDEVVAGHRRRG